MIKIATLIISFSFFLCSYGQYTPISTSGLGTDSLIYSEWNFGFSLSGGGSGLITSSNSDSINNTLSLSLSVSDADSTTGANVIVYNSFDISEDANSYALYTDILTDSTADVIELYKYDGSSWIIIDTILSNDTLFFDLGLMEDSLKIQVKLSAFSNTETIFQRLDLLMIENNTSGSHSLHVLEEVTHYNVYNSTGESVIIKPKKTSSLYQVRVYDTTGKLRLLDENNYGIHQFNLPQNEFYLIVISSEKGLETHKIIH